MGEIITIITGNIEILGILFFSMAIELEKNDQIILRALQNDGSLSLDGLCEVTGLSRNTCWRRLKRLEAEKVISDRVIVIDPDKVGFPLTAMVMVRAADHDPQWLERFNTAIKSLPEIQGAYRLSGDLDYMLRVVVADMKAYDAFYQRLVAKIKLADVSASFVMEKIVDHARLPI